MKAELDKLALVLVPEELDAVHVIIDAMVRMAGRPQRQDDRRAATRCFSRP